MTDVSLSELDYGPCPECGEDMTDADELHTWPGDNISDCHAECCVSCRDVHAQVSVWCGACLSQYAPTARHTCYDW